MVNIKKIAILGPDGAGKSTIIEKLNLYLNNDKTNVFHFHLKTGVKHKKPKEPIFRTNVKQYNLILSILKLIYLLFESYARDIFYYIKHKSIKNKIYIYDRHIVEILFDKKRFGYNGPYALLELFYLMVRKPQKIYVVLARADQLVLRKNELSDKEAKDIVEHYIQVSSKLNMIIVWNDKDIERLVSKILFETFNSELNI